MLKEAIEFKGGFAFGLGADVLAGPFEVDAGIGCSFGGWEKMSGRAGTFWSGDLGARIRFGDAGSLGLGGTYEHKKEAANGYLRTISNYADTVFIIKAGPCDGGSKEWDTVGAGIRPLIFHAGFNIDLGDVYKAINK